MAVRTPPGRAQAALAVVSALSLVATLVYTFIPDGAIAYSLGAEVTIASTALMLIAAGAIAAGFARGGVRTLLSALILLDILGTAFAAYMLEADALLGLMALALVVWFWGLETRRPAPRVVEATP